MKHHPERIDVMIEIFTSILTGGEVNKRLAINHIRKLTPEARRDLRAVCQNVDNLVEDTWFDEMREERIKKRKHNM
jgi:hypothetical protein